MNRKFLLIIVLLSMIGWSTQAHAFTYWDENFENHLWTATNYNPWDTSACTGSATTAPPDGCNPRIVTDSYPGWPHSGTHSLLGDYTCPGAGGPTVQCGTFIFRDLGASSREIWTRFYYYTVGMSYQNTGSGETKQMLYWTPNVGPQFVLHHQSGGRDQTMNQQGVVDTVGSPCNVGDTACNYPSNMNPTFLSDNTVYCIETHVVLDTPGNNNGSIEIWTTAPGGSPVQGMGWYNRDFTHDATQQFFSIPQGFEIYVQSGGPGKVYYDDVAAGNTRIGCGALPPPDTTPPAIPLGVAVSLFAAIAILGGLYGGLFTNRIPVHRLALGHDYTHSKDLRTVAIPRSTNHPDAEYAVLVENRTGDSSSQYLALSETPPDPPVETTSPDPQNPPSNNAAVS